MVIVFLIYLLLPESIYGPGAVSYAPLETVVENRGWEGTEAFDVLVAPPNCNLLAEQGWLIVKGVGIFSVVVVDCAEDEHRELWEERGLLLDANKRELVGKQAWLILK